MTDLGKSTVGETLEDMLEGLFEREEVYGEAQKRVIAWQIEEARKGAGLSKSEVANRLGTSRSQVDRILDPTNVAVSLASLERAARVVGKRLRIEIVDP